jgi:outer membrane protein assembly factor BamB
VKPAVAVVVLAAATAWTPSARAGAETPAPVVRAEVVWRIPLPEAGRSSPRALDADRDGTEDVVLGRGLEDHWGEVLALDGRTGRTLWSRRVADEVLSATPLEDVNGDGVPDVFAGGRTRLRGVLALSGKDGSLLWSLVDANPGAAFLPVNFGGASLLDDRDGDGVRDLLVVQSGGKDSRRNAARYHVVSARSGKLLATHVARDGKESYAVPLYRERAGGAGELWIGTGGETLSGNLLKLRYPSFEEVWRVPALGGGFIGSATLVDLDEDGAEEIVDTAMAGGVYRIDAASGRVAWTHREQPWWTYVSPAVGAFGRDGAPGIVAAFNRGVWPRSAAADVVWLDAATGAVLARRSFGDPTRFVGASPLVVDLDLDGLDETLLVLSDEFLDPVRPGLRNRLVVFGRGD